MLALPNLQEEEGEEMIRHPAMPRFDAIGIAPHYRDMANREGADLAFRSLVKYLKERNEHWQTINEDGQLVDGEGLYISKECWQSLLEAVEK